MDKNTFYSLQNGSDIRGVSIGGVEGEDVNLTPFEASLLACVFVAYLKKKYNLTSVRVGVGRDSRISGPSLMEGVFDGLYHAGAEPFDCGLTSTPSMFMSTVLDGFKYDGAIMLTASHLPYNRNGMKFFTPDGGLEKADIKELLDLGWAKSGDEIPRSGKTPEKAPLVDAYSAFLRQKIIDGVNAPDRGHPLRGLHAVVDAGNGAGGFFAEKVLIPLGCDVSGSQFLEPDGAFPNHIPNPENKDAMRSICRCVIDNKADLGIIFDTDVDRASAVDKNGHEINQNAIVALSAAIVAQEHPHTAVVTDSVTSDKLTEFIEGSLGMKHHRFRRGYKNVINEAIRLNNDGVECHLAIETSGHCAFKENYFLDDGAYLTVKILIKAAELMSKGETIDSMLSALEEAREKKELRIRILCDDFKSYGARILEDYEKYCAEHGMSVAPNSYEGVRVSYGDDGAKGWSLLRMSLHDPILPLNIEADNEGGAAVIAERIRSFLASYDKLDLSVFGA